MTYLTYTQIEDRILRELDLLDEDIVSSAEVMSYVNEAIDLIESEILGIYEDYFLTSANLALVTGTSDYSLPATIYANKIRKVIYSSGAEIYTIDRIRGKDIFERIADITQNGSANRYEYILKNDSAASGVKFKLLPASRETSSANVTIWFLRNANRIATTTDLCDIPEGYNFVVTYGKYKCVLKEGSPMLDTLKQEVELQKNLLIETLSVMAPDDDNLVPMDMDFYDEHS